MTQDADQVRWWELWFGGAVLWAGVEITGNVLIGRFPLLLNFSPGSPLLGIVLAAVFYCGVLIGAALIIGILTEVLKRIFRRDGSFHLAAAAVLLIFLAGYIFYGIVDANLGKIDPSQGLPGGDRPPLLLWWWWGGIVAAIVMIGVASLTGIFRQGGKAGPWLVVLVPGAAAFNIADNAIGGDFPRLLLAVIVLAGVVCCRLILDRCRTSSRSVIISVGLIAAGAAFAQGIYFGWPGKDYDRHLILLLWDAQRPDRMGIYEEEYATTPVLSSLADRMIRFDRAYSPANYTFASVVSLLTGRYLREHHLYDGTIADIAQYDNFQNLAGDMEGKGYRPVMITENPWLVPLKQNFKEVNSYPTRRDVHSIFFPFYRGSFIGVQIIDHLSFLRDGIFKSTVVRRQDRYLAELLLRARRDGPYLVFACWMNVHSRYYPGGSGLRSTSPDALRTVPESEYLRATEYMDFRLGKWIARLRSAGQWDRSLTMLTADHGEFLGEFGLVGHGKTLLEPVLRVPLLLFGPEVDPGVIEQPVPLVALRKAIGALAARRGEWDTEAFVREMLDNRGMVVEGSFDFEGPDGSIRWFLAAWEGEMKYMQDNHRYIPDQFEGLDTESFYFYYNLAEDPGELRNLASDRPDEVVRMQDLIARWETDLDPASLPPLEEEEVGEYPPGLVEQLRALGYIR